MTNWPTPEVVQMQKSFHLQGSYAPDVLARRSAPGPRWELCFIFLQKFEVSTAIRLEVIWRVSF